MRIRWTVIAAFLIAASTLQAQRGNPDIRFENESVDQLVAAFMKAHDVPGLSLAIVQAPYVTRATGFGIADAQRRTLVSAHTMFDVAQMKNAFTAVAAMQLVEEEKVVLQDVLPLLREPGESSRLESVIAKASGKTFQQFVRERQFDRLGLEHTFFASELAAVPHEELAHGERHRGFFREAALIDPTEAAAGDGDSTRKRSDADAIYSSASDISVWDIALAGEVLVKDPAMRKLLYEPRAGEDGAVIPSSGPWYFPGHPGLMISTGSRAGFSSLLSRFTHRDELVCVTLLANREGLDLTQLARKIAGAFNPRLGPPKRAAGRSVQQSPYSLRATLTRLTRTLSDEGFEVTATDFEKGSITGTFGNAEAWAGEGEVWVAVSLPAPESAEVRRIDRALLSAVSAQ